MTNDEIKKRLRIARKKVAAASLQPELTELAELRAFRDDVRAIIADVTDTARLPHLIRARLARLDSGTGE